MNRTQAFTRETLKISLTLGPCEGRARRQPIYGQDANSHRHATDQCLILHFPASRIVRYKFLLFRSHPSLWYSVITAQQTKTDLLLFFFKALNLVCISYYTTSQFRLVTFPGQSGHTRLTAILSIIPAL